MFVCLHVCAGLNLTKGELCASYINTSRSVQMFGFRGMCPAGCLLGNPSLSLTTGAVGTGAPAITFAGCTSFTASAALRAVTTPQLQSAAGFFEISGVASKVSFLPLWHPSLPYSHDLDDLHHPLLQETQMYLISLKVSTFHS